MPEITTEELAYLRKKKAEDDVEEKIKTLNADSEVEQNAKREELRLLQVKLSDDVKIERDKLVR